MSRSSDFIIRSAEPRDAANIAEYANALGRETGGDGTAMTVGDVARSFIGDDNGLDVLVAERGGEAVAYALHSIAYETAFAVMGRYISDLYVAPSARRIGIARALMARIARIAADEGGGFLWWMAKPHMPDGLRLYGQVADQSDPVTAFAATREHFAALVDADGAR